VKSIVLVRWVAVSLVTLAAPLAHAEQQALELEPTPTFERTSGSVDHLESMWRFELGYRGNFVTSPGYNPFSTQDYLSQVSMGASRTIYTRGRFSFAPGFSWDYGRSGATARGDMSSLEVHRLALPLEGRVHFGPWGYAFLRAAPALAMERVEVDDATAPAPLTKSRWLFATDLSAGYAYPVWSRAPPSEVAPRIWLQADGGYGWIVAQRLDLSPDLPAGDPRLAGGVDLGSLTMQGAFFRVAAAVSF
jgi:hypothetical protein